ncbi:hypothetical protein [Allohahella marinimesophila]|uniref:Uncharacterized protein n=1 Tax=Allohahella marinimesophila TaxID=1054972 RepID=A0ABP7PD74_9GAMM
MGITVFKDKADSSRSYLRITRAVDGEEQQHYVRVNGTTKKAMREAMAEAEALDAELARWQADRKAEKEATGESFIHDRGHVLGLQLQKREREGRKDAIEFKLRVKPEGSPPVYSSVSVDKYGFEEAFKRSIDRLCEVRGIDTKSPVAKKLSASLPIYRERYEAFEAESLAKENVAESSSGRQNGILGQLRGWVKRRAT